MGTASWAVLKRWCGMEKVAQREIAQNAEEEEAWQK
jgi:hypothetical protein